MSATRKSYINTVVDNTVQDNKLSPAWHKVSATPYDTLSKNVGGYGRKVRGITLSPDCPVEFIRTEHLARPRDFTPAPKEIASRKAGVEASYVLPGGSSYTEQPIHGRSYSKFNMENRLIMEPGISDRSEGRVKLSWNSGRLSSRPSTSHHPTPRYLPKDTSSLRCSHLLSPVQKTHSRKSKGESFSGVGGVRPDTGGCTLATRSGAVPIARGRTRKSSGRANTLSQSGAAFSDAPKSFKKYNKQSWWIHED